MQAENKDHLGKFICLFFYIHPLTEERIELLHQVATDKGWQMTGEVTDVSVLLKIE